MCEPCAFGGRCTENNLERKQIPQFSCALNFFTAGLEKQKVAIVDFTLRGLSPPIIPYYLFFHYSILSFTEKFLQKMAAPDMELKQAFAELQAKVVESKQKIKLHDLQIENMKRSITHSTLTDTEIGQLPEGTKVS